MVCALNNCFCCKKGEINFTQSDFKNMDKEQSAYGVGTKQLYQCWKCTFSFSGALRLSQLINRLYAITITLHIAQLCLLLS